MSRRNFFILILLFIYKCHYSQTAVSTLSVNELMEIVKRYHPVVKQTNMKVNISKADILISKGGFDPVLNRYDAKKTFDGTNYYTYSATEAVIPTWYGIEVYTGLENLNGIKLDNSDTKGKTGYAGISVPLGRDLVIDKRRAALFQARIFNSMAIAEQKTLTNNLMMEAVEAYWLWVKAYKTYQILDQLILVNDKRIALIKKSFQHGERPAIDTIEALAQLQLYQYQQNNSLLAFQNAGLALSAFLWDSNTQPYFLPPTVIPVDGWENDSNYQKVEVQLDTLLGYATVSHPELKWYDLKLQSLDIEKKLKFQEILPKVDLRYNQLWKGSGYQNANLTFPLFENNYQYGLKVEVPLRLSNGRGEYKKAGYKIGECELLQNQKRRAIELKVRSYYNELLNLKSQVELLSKNYNNYQILAKAEESRYNNGESSLFLINSRENKVLESLEKLIEVKTKYQKTLFALQWSAGNLVY